MALLELKDISLSFGSTILLNKIDLFLEEKERVAVVGRNGEGKTTLLKIILNQIQFKSGERFLKQGTTIGYLSQEVPTYPHDFTLFDFLATNFEQEKIILSEYYKVTEMINKEPNSQKHLKLLTKLQGEITDKNLWGIDNKIQETLSKFKLNGSDIFNSLSTGRKRVSLLAKAFITDPDILILDEPTNHLDIDTIIWLEDLLMRFTGTLLFVSHDRILLNKFATRIIEIDRGKCFSWVGNYDKYLVCKEHWLNVEEEKQKAFTKKLKTEEAWLRRGIKARRTRNEGRVRSLKKLREEGKDYIALKGKANLQIQQISKSGKKVIEANNISFGYQNNQIVDNLSLEIRRGDKLGIIGPNGCGKSTIIKLLVGDLLPDQGSIEYGTNLEISYFDQNRLSLDLEKSVKNNLCSNSDTIFFNGQPRHIISYLQDFLFEADSINTPVKVLSGGEKNRLLLAKLFSTPANLLILDEPTNDLDMDTLELLESLLVEYEGTIIFISHDRSFLNNVSTNILAYEKRGCFQEYFGGYDDLKQAQKTKNNLEKETVKTKKKLKAQKVIKKIKLTFKEEKELEELPAKIEELEEQKEQLLESMSNPETFKDGGDIIKEINQNITNIDISLEKYYERWEYLESYKK